MAVIGKCVGANPQRNGTALVAISRMSNQVKVYGNFQAPMDTATANTRLSNRLNAVNYYYGGHSGGTVGAPGQNSLRWSPF